MDYERTLPSDLSFSNLTFRDLLNKTTKVKRGGWILRRGKGFGKEYKEYLEINI